MPPASDRLELLYADLIRTARLDLVPMTPEFLAASLQGDRAQLGLILGVSIPDDWPDESPWPERRLDQLRTDPSLQPWLLRAIVLRGERRMIGHVGFHGRPGEEYLEALAPGGVEFGYTVFEKDRRQGYAREACETLMQWANRSHRVTRFVVSISPANVASLALAKGLGFSRIGSHVDEEDGPEDIFERRMEAER
jgi:ribosomal-protein-alanine N-acetyltransferase